MDRSFHADDGSAGHSKASGGICATNSTADSGNFSVFSHKTHRCAPERTAAAPAQVAAAARAAAPGATRRLSPARLAAWRQHRRAGRTCHWAWWAQRRCGARTFWSTRARLQPPATPASPALPAASSRPPPARSQAPSGRFPTVAHASSKDDVHLTYLNTTHTPALRSSRGLQGVSQHHVMS